MPKLKKIILSTVLFTFSFGITFGQVGFSNTRVHLGIATAKASEGASCQSLFFNEIANKTAAAETIAKRSFFSKLGHALLIFPIPYKPLKDVITNTNKRFFVFIERPAVSLLTTSIGVSIARYIMKSDSSWLGNFADSFVSFTLKDIVANGIALQHKSVLSEKQKYWINYFYTVGFYSIVTMLTSSVISSVLPVLSNLGGATPTEINAASYAIGLVSFAFAWPLISQGVNTNIMAPLLFRGFPQDSDMKRLQTSENGKILVQETYQGIEKIRAEIATLEAKNSQDPHLHTLKKDLGYDLKKYYWIKWRAQGLEVHDTNPFTGRTVKKAMKPLTTKGYWFLKTALISTVASFLIVGYFLARNALIGTSVEDIGFLTEYIVRGLDALKDADINAMASSIWEQTPPDLMAEHLGPLE